MKVATDTAPEWQALDTLPYGHKCLLLTTGGVAVVGSLSSSLLGYVAWCPLPKVPQHIKDNFFRSATPP